MRGLVFERPGELRWRDVEAPELQGPAEALVRPLAVARCDLDAGILRGEAPFRGRALHWLRNRLPDRIGQQGIFRNAPFRGPFAFGHECVAEVLAVGSAVTGVAVGDRVVVPFQISCGACAACGAGLTSSCDAVPPRSMYGFGDLGGRSWGGVLADRVRVPFADAMLVKVPDHVGSEVVASLGDNVVDGYRTVAAPLAKHPGAAVLVVGGLAASVGLYAVASAVALGAARVDYLDIDAARLEVAVRLGANPVRTARAYPITVDASAHPGGLAKAVLATAPGGTCTSVGIYYTPRTPFPLLGAYGIGLTFVTGRVRSRAMLPEVLAMVAAGTLRPEEVTTRVADWEDAPRAFLDAGPKVVVVRD
ncbi:MAG: alcohol dehydrogenase catalytic domain-containing protein [Polyangiaceae bacterium]|nr:alcohol dehydrogenase catalytic domain-containing protein [Polyangiaceae bacterium]